MLSTWPMITSLGIGLILAALIALWIRQLRTVLERFPSVRRLILVADRGLLSLDNLAALKDVRLSSGQALEFILAVPARRYSEFADLLTPFHRAECCAAAQEVI